MENSGAPQIDSLPKVRFGPVLSLQTYVMQLSLWILLFTITQNVALSFDGAFVEHPDVSWIGNNTSKCFERQLEYWTVISTRAFGSNHKVPQEFIAPSKEKEVTHLLLNGSAEVTGADCKNLNPYFAKVQLWDVANPSNALQGKGCVSQTSHNVGICGDWLVSPCIEGAVIRCLSLSEVIDQHVQGERCWIEKSSATIGK